MGHPDKSMLLAATRQQPDGWSGDIKQHIDECSECHARYTEYQRINATLIAWANALGDHVYPPIADVVTQKLHEWERLPPLSANSITVAKRTGKRITFPAWHLASPYVAAVAAVFCTLLIFALAAYVHTSEEGTIGFFTAPKPNATAGESRGQPRPRLPVVSPVTQSAPSGGTAHVQPDIVVCSSPTDVQQARLHICGYNFKPGSRVSLIIEIRSRPKVRKLVVVHADGTIEDWLIVHDCNTLPLDITAQYDNTSVTLARLENIQFEGCEPKT